MLAESIGTTTMTNEPSAPRPVPETAARCSFCGADHPDGACNSGFAPPAEPVEEAQRCHRSSCGHMREKHYILDGQWVCGPCLSAFIGVGQAVHEFEVWPPVEVEDEAQRCVHWYVVPRYEYDDGGFYCRRLESEHDRLEHAYEPPAVEVEDEGAHPPGAFEITWSAMQAAYHVSIPMYEGGWVIPLDRLAAIRKEAIDAPTEGWADAEWRVGTATYWRTRAEAAELRAHFQQERGDEYARQVNVQMEEASQAEARAEAAEGALRTVALEIRHSSVFGKNLHCRLCGQMTTKRTATNGLDSTAIRHLEICPLGRALTAESVTPGAEG